MAVTRRGFLPAGAPKSTALILRPASLPVRPEEVLKAELIEEVEPYEGPLRQTRLEVFLKARGIKPAHLAKESGYSRQHLLRLRMGTMDPTRRCMAAITAACRRLSGTKVKAAQLFNLETV